MNDARKIAIAAAVALAAGFGLGRYAGGGADAGLPAGHPPTTGPAAAHAGMPAEEMACEMRNCGEERPAMEKRLAANPDDAEALIALGACDVVCRDEGGGEAAGLERLGRGVILATRAADLLLAGKTYQKLAKPDLALAAFEKGLVEAPDDAELLYRAGLVSFHSLGDDARAAGYWERYLRARPDAPNADVIRRAVEQIRSGRS